ncbi:IclR family transcriptional regulator, partial [Bacillaceae bacterium Marseille-Q3522]|nr:IclR family transcriptional regulator [Bacillaceae bacterium Marseille-Q3522]
MDEKENFKGLRTVQRSINIINCFSFDESELSLTEIANKIDLAKSTTSRILDTLVQNGLIQKNISNLKYKLGYKIYHLGRIAEKSFSIDIVEIARPFMEQLRNNFEESVGLYLLENNKRTCIERCGSNQSLRHVINIGETLPLEIGSGGKVLLAFQSKQFIDSRLNSIKSEQLRNKLIDELPIIQKEYVAVSFNERGAGVNSIAVPIVGINNTVNYCISISGPSTRFTAEKINSIKKEVKNT